MLPHPNKNPESKSRKKIAIDIIKRRYNVTRSYELKISQIITRKDDFITVLKSLPISNKKQLISNLEQEHWIYVIKELVGKFEFFYSIGVLFYDNKMFQETLRLRAKIGKDELSYKIYEKIVELLDDFALIEIDHQEYWEIYKKERLYPVQTFSNPEGDPTFGSPEMMTVWGTKAGKAVLKVVQKKENVNDIWETKYYKCIYK